MKSKRYNNLVSLCVWFLRITMIVIAVAIPVVVTINSFILRKLLGVQVENPQVYYLYYMTFSELILGYLLSLFINFKEKLIFVEENARYLRTIGYLVILKDFLYIPLDFIFNRRINIPLNFSTWAVGCIMVLFSRLLLHGIKIAREQEYTV